MRSCQVKDEPRQQQQGSTRATGRPPRRIAGTQAPARTRHDAAQPAPRGQQARRRGRALGVGSLDEHALRHLEGAGDGVGGGLEAQGRALHGAKLYELRHHAPHGVAGDGKADARGRAWFRGMGQEAAGVSLQLGLGSWEVACAAGMGCKQQGAAHSACAPTAQLIPSPPKKAHPCL